MAKTICVFNQKGGVGKSTTTSNVMAVMTGLGKRVLGIDIDAQGHLTKFCGIDCENENTVLEMFKDAATFTETVKNTKYGDVLPCDRNLQMHVLSFAADANFPFRIKEIAAEVGKYYDYIFIDCPPAVNQMTTAALVASDYVIIPTEAEYFSMDGVNEIANTLAQVKKNLNQSLKVLGLLLVKYNQRRTLTQELENLLKGAAQKLFKCNVFDTKIRFTVDIPASQALRQSLHDYKASCAAAEDYDKLVQEIIKGVR
jgi:chromosome partitioning protein